MNILHFFGRICFTSIEEKSKYAVIQKVELIKRDIKPLENQEKFLCRGVALSPFKASDRIG